MSKIATIRFYVKRVGVLGCIIELLHREHLFPAKWYDGNKLLVKRKNRYCENYLNSSREKQEEALYEYLGFCGGSMSIPPKTLNEKIQWLKVHGDLELYTLLADKWRVRDWIEDKIGGKYLIPCVGGPWKNVDDIDFSELPSRYVLKSNQGSGMNLIVNDKDKLDCNLARNEMKKWLDEIYGCYTMEPQYYGMERLIYAEEYMEESNGNLMDYKFFCFNGVPEYVQCIGDRKSGGKQIMYDMNWNRQRFNDDYDDYPEYEKDLDVPSRFEEMRAIAARLSEGIPFVRVDLYLVDDNVFFGEMTLTPVGGCEKWKSEQINLMLGEKVNLESN